MDLSVISTSTLRSALPVAAWPGFVGLLLLGGDVAFVDQLLHQPVQQLVHLLRRHVFQRLLDLLGLLGIEHLALLERVAGCAFFRSSSVCWFHSLKLHVLDC